MRRNKFSGDHFRRRYQTAPWKTFAATRPSFQIILGILVIIIEPSSSPWLCHCARGWAHVEHGLLISENENNTKIDNNSIACAQCRHKASGSLCVRQLVYSGPTTVCVCYFSFKSHHIIRWPVGQCLAIMAQCRYFV